MISEVIREDEHSNSSNNCDDSYQSNHSDDDFDRKSDNAVDYSDINELAEDLQVLMQEVKVFLLMFVMSVFDVCGLFLSQSAKERSSADDSNYDDIEDSIPVNKVSNDTKYSDQNSHHDGSADGKRVFSCFNFVFLSNFK